MSHKLSLLAPLICGVTLIVFTGASNAQAAPTIAISVGTDPAESITTQLGVSGAAEGESHAYLRVKPAGGHGCAANAEADEGAPVISGFGLGIPNAGPYSEAVNWTFQAAGSYLLCAWLQPSGASGSSVVASASLTIAVRQPHLALSIQAPSTVNLGQTFQVAMTVQAEAEREAYEYLLPNTGRGCPANAAAAGSTAGELGIRPFGVSVTGGPSTSTDNEELMTVGAYLVCAYVEYPGSESVPEATASAAISAIKPTPPCVVPRLGAHQDLGAVERRIRAAHCSVGKVRHTYSSRHRRGVVLELGPRPGTQLATHAAIAVDVSSGPPPHAKRRRRR